MVIIIATAEPQEVGAAAILTLEVIRGSSPSAKQRRVLASAHEHQGELALNWIRCQDEEPPERI